MQEWLVIRVLLYCCTVTFTYVKTENGKVSSQIWKGIILNDSWRKQTSSIDSKELKKKHRSQNPEILAFSES